MTGTEPSDQGQRYEIIATGDAEDTDWTVVGYAETREEAGKLANEMRKAPGFTSTTIVDRHGVELPFTQYGGILR